MSYNLPDGCTDADIERYWGDPEEDEEDVDECGVRNYEDLARSIGITVQQARDAYPREALEAIGLYFD